MNKHILLVLRWLSDEDSVTLQELNDNRDSAFAAVDVDGAIDAAAEYAYTAAYTASYDADVAAENWVTRYFQVSGDDPQEYIDANEGL